MSEKEENILEDVVREIILDIGIPDHLKGHPYVIEAVRLATEDRMYLEMVTKKLYPEVAKTFGSTPSRVERAIRHCIENAWVRGDLDTLRGYFGNTVSARKGKPTNSEFIARIANVSKQRVKEAMRYA